MTEVLIFKSLFLFYPLKMIPRYIYSFLIIAVSISDTHRVTAVISVDPSGFVYSQSFSKLPSVGRVLNWVDSEIIPGFFRNYLAATGVAEISIEAGYVDEQWCRQGDGCTTYR